MRSIKKFIDEHYDKDVHEFVKVSPEGLAKLYEDLDVNPITTNLKNYKGISIRVCTKQKENIRLCKKRLKSV